jgi:GNAT superfamily N-acetyltransferase
MTIRISPMTDDGIDFAVALTDTENWSYRRSDFQRLIDLAPGGCFIARGTFRRIGFVATMTHGDYGFMGALVVMKRHRRRGVGEALLVHAIRHLEDRGVKTIEFNGVFPAVPFYRRLGFRDKFLSLRFVRPPSPCDLQPGQLLTVTTDQIVRFDREHLPIDRSAVLSRLCVDFGDSLFAIGDGQLSAYAFVKPRPSGSVAIGPFVAKDSDAAIVLLKTILSRYHDKTILIVVPEMKTLFVQALLAEHFVYQFPWLRMYSGARQELDDYTYGMISPEKG